MDAATLVADITGFTELAESFASKGTAGAEQLGQRLNDILSEIIDVITAYRGDIVAVPGDGVIAVWPSDVTPDLPLAVRLAAACALAIQHSATAARGAHDVSLRIGVGGGRLWCGVVGGVGDDWRVCTGGPELAAASAASRTVGGGEVAVSAAAAAILSGTATLAPVEGASWRLSALHGFTPPPGATERRPMSSPEWLDADSDRWVAEFRTTVVLFANVGNLDFEDPDIGAEVDALARTGQEAVNQFGGRLTELLFDESGLTLLAVWGTPGAMHEDDARRAVECALTLKDRLPHAGVGIASGRVFWGLRGGGARREYAVIGDRVNVAARLMQVCGGDVLVDASTAAGIAHRVELSPPASIPVRGRQDPVVAHRALARVVPAAAAARVRAAPRRPLVGRDIERHQLQQWLDTWLSSSRGGIVTIEGEAGIGKSSLLNDFMAAAGARVALVATGGGDAIDSSPYLPWRSILGTLLDTSRAGHAARAAPIDAGDAALLADLLGTGAHDTEQTRHLTGTSRIEATCEAVSRLVREALGTRPALVAVEDVHWMDSASWALLRAIVREVPRVLVVVTSRPVPAEELPREARELQSQPDRRLLPLGPLSDVDTERLMQSALGVADVSPQAVQYVWESGGGQPLITEQLALALRDAGFLTVVGSRCRISPQTPELSSSGLPRTIEGIVARRVEQLSARQMLIVKVAAVLGSRFELGLVHRVFPVEIRHEELTADVAALLDSQLFAAAPPETGVYRFSHALTREAVYARLPYGQRQHLHQRVAVTLETRGGADAAVLAHHWDRAGQPRKACDYAERAGDAALRSGANREAAALFGRLIALLRESAGALDDVVAVRGHARWHCKLGVALYALGELTSCREQLHQSLATVGHPWPRSDARWMLLLLRHTAQQLVLRTVGWRARSEDAEPLTVASVAAQRLGETYLWGRRPLEMLTCTLLSANTSERAGRTDGRARDYATLAFSLGVVRQHALAQRYFARARAIAESSQDLPGRVFVGYAQGVYLIGMARWAESRAAIDPAHRLSHELRDPQEIELVETALANLEFMTGQFAASAARYEAIGASGRRRANVQHEAWGLYGAARSLLPMGQTAAAERAIQAALAIYGEVPESISELICHGLLADSYVTEGRLDDALREARITTAMIRQAPPSVVTALQGYAGAATAYLAALARATREGRGVAEAQAEARRSCRDLRGYAFFFPIGWARAYLSRGCYHWLRGRQAAARRDFRRSLDAALHTSMPYEQALAHQHLALSAPRGSTVAAASRDAMQTLLQSLGAVEPRSVIAE